MKEMVIEPGGLVPSSSRPAMGTLLRRQMGIHHVWRLATYSSALAVQENVVIVAKLGAMKSGEARKKAASILTELSLGEWLNFLPKKLSGGEKRRAEIARALVNCAALILADEPIANLDSKTGHEVMRLLGDIAKEQGRSVVIVSHDQRIKDIADYVLWLEDGHFRDIVTMAIDPIYGMAVERDKSIRLD